VCKVMEDMRNKEIRKRIIQREARGEDTNMKTFWDEVRRDNTIKCAQENYALGIAEDKIIEFLMGMLRVDEKEASHIFETEVKKISKRN